jgi:UDP-N-acetylmuramoylalanine--D-glutamate ligase
VDLAYAIARETLAELAARQVGGEAAVGPATVLLSPAAASFDMFADYAARGAAFRAAAEAMARRRAVVRSRR